MKRYIEIEILQSGQPRAYADSIYEGFLRYSADGMWAGKPNKEVAKEEAQVLIHKFVEKDAEREWHLAYLEECKNTGENEWYFKIIQPYTD